jgi:hypothetical protein
MRRGSRHWHPDVMDAVHEELSTGASASGVWDKLQRRQKAGELRDKDGKALALPSIRSIQEIAKAYNDDSGPWTLYDARPDDVQVILESLLEVIVRSEGRVQHLTRREARLVAAIRRVEGTAQYDAWSAFVLARHYIAAEPNVEAKAIIAELAYQAGTRYLKPEDLGVPLYNEKRQMELRRRHLAKYGKVMKENQG